MASAGWQAQLDMASNEYAVAAVCNRFLGTWTADELSEIPPGCRPDDVIEAEAIAAYAIKLIAAVGVGDRMSAPTLYKMSTFFTKAALRLADVMDAGIPRLAPARDSSSSSSAER